MSSDDVKLFFISQKAVLSSRNSTAKSNSLKEMKESNFQYLLPLVFMFPDLSGILVESYLSKSPIRLSFETSYKYLKGGHWILYQFQNYFCNHSRQPSLQVQESLPSNYANQFNQITLKIRFSGIR
eukprot:403336869